MNAPITLPATRMSGPPVPLPGRPSVLVDLRPCYEGFAGIPQETRLLFAMFADMGLGRLGGLASGIHFAAPPRRSKKANTPFDKILEQARVIVSMDTKRHHAPPGLSLVLPGPIRRRMHHVTSILALAQREERLDLRIDPALFEDYLWMKLFDNTLAPSDRHLIGRAEYFATALGHENARSLSLLPLPFQRRVNTTGWDVFFGATVSPYRPSPGTAFMIRYYDALPLVSPHTIGEPWPHTNSHARMLYRNMLQGANFYCDSEPVREDVLTLFPGQERRVHTIPALVAPEYRPDVRPEAELRTILRRRASQATAPAGGRREGPNDPLPKLIIACSTLEPRKNYLRLFRGFEIARRITKTPMQLLIVANPGWRSDAELAELKLLVREGAYHVSGVPLPELRLLYSMAHLVVAPSRAEGFDYSGVEGMACGTPLVASGIPVHRWVYGDAAEYFDPYDDEQLGEILARLCDLPRETGYLSEMRDRGLRQAALYQAPALAPRWEQAVLDVIKATAAAPSPSGRGSRRIRPPMLDPSLSRRLDNFDFLRVFAALMVIYGHGWNLSTDGGPGFWGVPFARIGLDIFFSISGYMVTGSWLRTPGLLVFLQKRALRILPGLAACVVFWFLAGARLSRLPLMGYLTNHNSLKYLSNIILHPVLYLPGVFVGLREHGAVNGSLWSLFPEALCYLTVPLFALLALRPRMWALGLVGVAVGSLGLWLFYGYDGPVWVINATDVKYMLVQVPFFFIGGLLRLLQDRVPELYRADFAILGYSLNWMVSSWYGWWNIPVEWLTLPYMVITFGRGSMPGIRRAGRFGDLSYGMYLYAFPVQQVILGARPDFGYPILACMVLTAPLALLSWHLVERPALRWKPAARRGASPVEVGAAE